MKRARFVFVVASARVFAPPAPPVMQAVQPTALQPGLQPAWQPGMRPALQSAAHPTHELRNAPSRNTVPLAPLAMLAIIGTAFGGRLAGRRSASQMTISGPYRNNGATCNEEEDIL